MTVTVSGVMVLEYKVGGSEGEGLPVLGRLVDLTVCNAGKGGPRTLKQSGNLVVWPDFEKAAQDAFAWWPQEVGNVTWTLAFRGSSQDLPELRGPSLGATFAVALTLLYFRSTGTRPPGADPEFADAVEFANLSSVAITGTVANAEARAEAIEFGAVGEIALKVTAGLPLVVALDQKVAAEPPARILRAGSVKDAINLIFDLEALNALRI